MTFVPLSNPTSPLELELLRKKLFQHGFDISSYSAAYVSRRMNACLMRRDCSLLQYTRLLDNDPAEYLKFIDTFTVNVTEYFRDPSMWKLFSNEILPRLLIEKASRNEFTLRVWSVGCASGEEPYTIAIVIKEALEQLEKRKRPSGFSVQILATDIDDGSLEKARKGLYGKGNLKNLDPVLLRKYFTKAASKDPRYAVAHQLSPAIMSMVKFEKHNFLAEKPFLKQDIVFCRNVTIYFRNIAKEEIHKTICAALNPGGIYVTGKTELFMAGEKQIFEPIDIVERIYRKTPAPGEIGRAL